MTPSEVQQMLEWCEEEAALTTAKCSEEIQAEKDARKRYEEAVAGELEEITARTSLGRVWTDFDWERSRGENEKPEKKEKKKDEKGKE